MTRSRLLSRQISESAEDGRSVVVLGADVVNGGCVARGPIGGLGHRPLTTGGYSVSPSSAAAAATPARLRAAAAVPVHGRPAGRRVIAGSPTAPRSLRGHHLAADDAPGAALTDRRGGRNLPAHLAMFLVFRHRVAGSRWREDHEDDFVGLGRVTGGRTAPAGNGPSEAGPCPVGSTPEPGVQPVRAGYSLRPASAPAA
jgi:hypothetical protein